MKHVAWLLVIAWHCSVLSVKAETPIPAPTFSLDFQDDQFLNNAKAQVVFRRQGSAYFFNSAGAMVEAANASGSDNVPRIEFDPFQCASPYENLLSHPTCTRRLRGLVIEEERENFILESERLNRPSWVRGGGQLVRREGESPRLTDSFEFRAPTEGMTAALRTSAVLPSTGPVVLSFFVKDVHPGVAIVDAPARPAPFRVKLMNGAQQIAASGIIDVRAQTFDPGSFKPADDTSTDIPGGVMPITKDWYRVSMRLADCPATNVSVVLDVLPATSEWTGRNLHLWGFQLEQGRFPTSYIPTSGASEVRGREELVILPLQGNAFSWFNDVSGSFLLEADGPYITRNEGAAFMVLRHPEGFQALRQYGMALGYEFSKRGSEPVRIGSDEADPWMKRAHWETIGDIDPFRISFGYSNAASGTFLGASVNGAHYTTPTQAVLVESGEATHITRQRIIPPQGLTQLARIELGASGFNGHLRRLEYRRANLSVDNHSKLSSLGTKPVTLGRRNADWIINHAMSEECSGPRELLDRQWRIQDSADLDAEKHIASVRRAANIVIREAGQPVNVQGQPAAVATPEKFCVFITRLEGGLWNTGTMVTRTSQKYGYFESRYKVNGYLAPGAPYDPFHNNAFWLMADYKDREGTWRADFEIDVNEGKYATLVEPSVHNHRDSRPFGSGELHALSHRRWFGAERDTPRDQFHTYALHWSVGELIWYVDGRMVRRSPNFYAHRPSRVYFSTSILKTKDIFRTQPVAYEDIPAQLHGKDVWVDYIRTFSYSPP